MSDAFIAYAITTLILCLNLVILWSISGGARVKSRSTPNPEDARTVSRGATVLEQDPPGVSRVLRAHTNTFVNTVPFLFLGQVYVAAGASSTMAWVLFGSFAAARVVYSACYLAGLQPWRSVAFAVGMLATFGVMIDLVVLLVR